MKHVDHVSIRCCYQSIALSADLNFLFLFFLFDFFIVIIIIIIIIIIILMWRLCRHELVYADMGWIIQIFVGF